MSVCGGPLATRYSVETMVNRDGIGSTKLFCTPKIVKDAGVFSYFAAEMDLGDLERCMADPRAKLMVLWWGLPI